MSTTFVTSNILCSANNVSDNLSKNILRRSVFEKQRVLIDFLDKVKILTEEKPLCILAPFVVFAFVMVTAIVVHNFLRKNDKSSKVPTEDINEENEMVSDEDFDMPNTQKYDISLRNSGIGSTNTVTDGFTSNKSSNDEGNILKPYNNTNYKSNNDSVSEAEKKEEKINVSEKLSESIDNSNKEDYKTIEKDDNTNPTDNRDTAAEKEKADISEKTSEGIGNSNKEDYKTIKKDDNTNPTDDGNTAAEKGKITVVVSFVALLYDTAILALYGNIAFEYLELLCWFSLPSIISLFVTFFPLVFIFIAFLQNSKLLSIILAITGLLPTFAIFFWIISFVSINRRLKEKNVEKLSSENYILYERTLAHYNQIPCKYKHTDKDFCPFLFKDKYGYADYLRYYRYNEDTIKILTKVYNALNGESSIYDKLYCYII